MVLTHFFWGARGSSGWPDARTQRLATGLFAVGNLDTSGQKTSERKSLGPPRLALARTRIRVERQDRTSLRARGELAEKSEFAVARKPDLPLGVHPTGDESLADWPRQKKFSKIRSTKSDAKLMGDSR